MRAIFSTPDEAELAFYEALECGDINQMKQVWSDDDSIVCIHPGAIRLEGRAEVVESFSQMFKESPTADDPGRTILVTDARYMLLGSVAVHMVREEISVDDYIVSSLLATNVYHYIDGSWRMTLHHASHEPDFEYEYEFELENDELEFATDTDADADTPVVLH